MANNDENTKHKYIWQININDVSKALIAQLLRTDLG